jgi:hypothetical protein
LDLFHANEFEIPAPQYSAHCSPARNTDVFDIVLHRNVVLSNIIFSDIQDSRHPPIIFHILDRVTFSYIQNRVEKFSDWEWFQGLVSDLLLRRIQINSREEDKVAPISSSYRPVTSRVTLPELNKNLPGLDYLVKHKERVRKLCHKSGHQARKAAVNWVTKASTG